MLFNSLQFFIFFVIVYLLYLGLRTRGQNIMLLAASYIFYGAWDWRFLSLLAFSTVVDFYCGRAIARSTDQRWRKRYLSVSVFVNLSLLGFFKYFDFFAASLNDLLGHLGLSPHPLALHVILPVGISFYTFQTLSYTLDIYYKKIKPTDNFWNFALFVSFFPQLVAGPIERASHLLPQMESPRTVTLQKFYEGCFLIFWGLFMKVAVADNLGDLVDPVFAGPGPYKGIVVLSALYAFAFQIFCDFAGYSNIARGLSKCMGFDIMVNFNLPYLATNPSDFWRRWHISLSSWLRDYLYIPLGGNRKGKWATYRNLFITMLLGGLWHGAAWTFVLWGLYQGLLLMAYRWWNSSPLRRFRLVPDFQGRGWFLLKVMVFFHITCFGWLIFRAQSVGQIGQMAGALLFGWQGVSAAAVIKCMAELMPFLWFLLVVQSYQFYKQDLLAIYKINVVARGVFYYLCFIQLIILGVPGAKEFIYFQF